MLLAGGAGTLVRQNKQSDTLPRSHQSSVSSGCCKKRIGLTLIGATTRVFAYVCTCVLLQPPCDGVPDVHRAFYKLAETDGRGLWHLPAGDRIAFPHKALTRCLLIEARESLDNVKEEREDIAVMFLTLEVREQMGG